MAVNAGLDTNLMHEVLNACRTKFKKDFKETQRLRSFKLQKLLLGRAVSETPEHGFEWTLRIKAAQGSTAMLDSFEQVTYVRDTYTASLKVSPRTVVTHTNMTFDRLAELINKKASAQLWKDYNAKASAAAESAAEMWESKLLSPPQSVSDKDGILGLLYWYRRSMTSGGVFTEQLTPARNGVYYRNGAGTVSAEMANIPDVSAAAYAKLRTLVGTHRGVMDQVMLKTLRDLVLDAGFEYLDELMGEKTTQDLVILWDDAFQRDYDDLCKALGAPLKRDFFATGDTTVKGVPTMAVPSFNNHFLRPVFGVNLAELKFRKEAGNWEVEGRQQLTHNSWGFPRDSRGQMWAENPSAHGFLCHGSFTTGT